MSPKKYSFTNIKNDITERARTAKEHKATIAQRSRRLSYFVGSSSPVTSMLISAVITCLGSLASLSFAASMMLLSFSELISLTFLSQDIQI